MNWIEDASRELPPRPEPPDAAREALFQDAARGRGTWWYAVTRDQKAVHVVDLSDADPAASKRTFTTPTAVRSVDVTGDGLLAVADNTSLHLVDFALAAGDPRHLRSFDTTGYHSHSVENVWFIRDGRGLVVAYDSDYEHDYDEEPFDLTHVFGIRGRAIRTLGASEVCVGGRYARLGEVDGVITTGRHRLDGFDEAWEAEMASDPTDDRVDLPY